MWVSELHTSEIWQEITSTNIESRANHLDRYGETILAVSYETSLSSWTTLNLNSETPFSHSNAICHPLSDLLYVFLKITSGLQLVVVVVVFAWLLKNPLLPYSFLCSGILPF